MAGLWSDQLPASGKSPEKLSGAWSEYFPSKPSSSAAPPPLSGYKRCFLCRTCDVSCRLLTSNTLKNPNRKFYSCNASPTDHKFFKWADEVSPDEIIDVPECGGCGAGTCRVRREKSGPNSGRVLFMCRIKEGEGSCGYSVWQDELQKAATDGLNENITSSQSPTINSSHTNTNFFQQSNENSSNESTLTDSSLQQPDSGGLTSEMIEHLLFLENKFNGSTLGDQRIADERVTLYPSHTVEENNESNEGDEYMGSPVVDTLQQMKWQENVPSESTSMRPYKRSRHGDFKAQSSLVSSQLLTVGATTNPVVVKHRWMIAATRENLSTQLQGWWGRLAFHPMPPLTTHVSKPFTCYVSSLQISGFTSQDILVKSMDLTTLTKTLHGSETHNMPLLNSCHKSSSSAIPPNDTSFQTVMSESISKAFTQAAENLQNDLLTLLEKMDVSDHEAMKRESEATFSALDQLHFNYQDLKDRTEEYIRCAISLAEIEHSMQGYKSCQEKISQYSSERMRLSEVSSDYEKATECFRKRLRSLQGMVSSTKDLLFQMEAEVSCFEVEMELKVDKISKKKEELEEKYATAGRELEKSREIIERKEAEREAAKAALESARVLLRAM